MQCWKLFYKLGDHIGGSDLFLGILVKVSDVDMGISGHIVIVISVVITHLCIPIFIERFVWNRVQCNL